MPVVISKNDRPSREEFSTNSRISSFRGISQEPSEMIFILSLKSVRCGEVYSPTRIPEEASPAAIMELTEPFPLVPATCMHLYCFQGSPMDRLNASMPSRPGLYAPGANPTFWMLGCLENSSDMILLYDSSVYFMFLIFASDTKFNYFYNLMCKND